jgi:hypothetical protein
MRLVVALIALLFMRHYGYQVLTDVWGHSAKVWFYAIGGFQEAILWLLIAGSASMTAPSLQRSLAIFAGVWGMTEGAQLGICRLMLPSVKGLSSGQGTCDLAFGIPMYALSISAAVLVFAYLIWGEFNGSRSS